MKVKKIKMLEFFFMIMINDFINSFIIIEPYTKSLEKVNIRLLILIGKARAH